jgi:hypothetical protein
LLKREEGTRSVFYIAYEEQREENKDGGFISEE